MPPSCLVTERDYTDSLPSGQVGDVDVTLEDATGEMGLFPTCKMWQESVNHKMGLTG